MPNGSVFRSSSIMVFEKCKKLNICSVSKSNLNAKLWLDILDVFEHFGCFWSSNQNVLIMWLVGPFEYLTKNTGFKYKCHGCFSHSLNVEVSVSLTIKVVVDRSLKVSYGLWDRTYIMFVFPRVIFVIVVKLDKIIV